jgi:hypothetical protein
MKLDLFCVGVCRDDGEPTQIAGCGIVSKFVDDHDRVQCREFGWALGNSSERLAQLQAARLALCSVLPQFRGYPATLHVSNSIVEKSLDIETDPEEFLYEIVALRTWYGYYKSITIIVSPMDERVVELANIALDTQQHYDSGTIGVD